MMSAAAAEGASQVGGGSNPKPRQKGYQYPKIFCKSWQISLVMQSHAMCPPLQIANTPANLSAWPKGKPNAEMISNL